MSLSVRYRRSSVGSSTPSSGAWCARTPIRPDAVRVETISTSSLNTSPSGVSTSQVNLECAITVLRDPRIGRCSSLLRLLDDRVDRPLHVEGAFGDVVVAALDDLLEAANRLGDRHVRAGRAGELLGNVERLREEALELARAVDGHAIVVGELVDAEDRDDVLQLLVALQNLLDLVGD